MTLLALVVVVVFGVGFVYMTNQEGEEVACTLGLPIFEGRGVRGTMQDHAPAGPDACDGPEVDSGMHVLGLDCNLRNPDGNVVAELEPNQPGGTCGLSVDGSPYPASWQTG